MRQILNIALFEMKQVFKDKILTLMVFAVPLVYAVFLGWFTARLYLPVFRWASSISMTLP